MKSGNFRNKGTGGEKGIALITILLVCLTIAGVVAASISTAAQRVVQERNHAESQKAFAAAEAGIDDAIALSNNNNFSSLAVNGTTTLAAIALEGATGTVSLKRLADTTTVSGGTTTTTQTLRVQSTGAFGASSFDEVGFVRRTITSVAVAITGNLPTVQSSVMLNDPFAQIRLNGNSFNISGFDKNIDGTNGPGAAVWGMGVGPQSNGQPGSVSGVTSQMTNAQKALITGQGPAPSVGAVGAANIPSIISALSPYTTISLNNVNGVYTANLGDYATNNPQLTYINGDIHISSNNTGYGIMLVNGNLTISGSWNYVGLLFVNGQVTFSGGGNQQKLTGAMFLTGDTRDLTVNGNITVQYSSQAVANVTNYLATFNTTTTTTSPYNFVSSAETNL